MSDTLTLIVVGLGSAIIGGGFSVIVAKINATNQKPIDNIATVQKTVDLLETERERLIKESEDQRLQHAREIEDQRKLYESRIEVMEKRHSEDMAKTNSQIAELAQQVRLLTSLREEDQTKIQYLHSVIGQDFVNKLVLLLEKAVQAQPK